jgi:hypothetical protein
MRILKRTLYLLYYIKETDRKQFQKLLNYASRNSDSTKLKIFADCIRSVYLYNISIKDYFCFRFYSLSKTERDNWAGTGYMYEYQKIMNPMPHRMVLEDKVAFLRHFKRFVNRSFFTISELKANKAYANTLLTNFSRKTVLKGSHGQIGAEVEVIQCSDFTPDSLIEYMTLHHYDLAEEYVVQHPALMALSPSGLNTVRVFTQLSNGKADILGIRLRVSVNSPVDNMAAGNLAAPVDEETGEVNGPAVYSDITKDERTDHPVTGISIVGFVIPHWNKVIDLARQAALFFPENKSIGWDIAITEIGVELIEGNHNWCKLLWQLPVKKGLKMELEKYR